MKRLIILLFLLYSGSVFSQDEFTIIYIDNHKTVNQFETIQDQLTGLITDNFLLYSSNGDYPRIFNDSASFNNSIRSTLLTPINRPSLQMELKYLENTISKKMGSILKIGKDTKTSTTINLHFFFDKNTFCNYELDKYFVNRILLIYKLRDRKGINSNCNITYHLFDNYDQSCTENINDKQIKIKTY